MAGLHRSNMATSRGASSGVAGRRTPSESDTSALFFAVLRELRWLELVEESGALLDRQLRARAGAAELFRAALRHRVLHRDVVPF